MEPRREQPHDSAPFLPAATRWLWFLLGWLFVGLGIAGTVLPLLPATPLFLLALWAFSRSSQRFHDWLYHHRVFGPGLQRWRRHRVIPRWTKALALGSMAATLLYVGLWRRPPWWALAAMAAVMAVGVAFITRFPSRPPPEPMPVPDTDRG